MKEMVYKAESGFELLATGESNGFPWGIVSYGVHPCAYVGVTDEHPLWRKDSMDEECFAVNCHGGVTYGGSYDEIAKGRWFLGWDYAHLGDYSGSSAKIGMPDDGKRWTTGEILNEVLQVCEQLRQMQEKADANFTYEVCPHCGAEVRLAAELKVQTCPECGKAIVACSMCAMVSSGGGEGKCPAECPLEYLARLTNCQ